MQLLGHFKWSLWCSVCFLAQQKAHCQVSTVCEDVFFVCFFSTTKIWQKLSALRTIVAHFSKSHTIGDMSVVCNPNVRLTCQVPASSNVSNHHLSQVKFHTARSDLCEMWMSFGLVLKFCSTDISGYLQELYTFLKADLYHHVYLSVTRCFVV